MADFDSYNSDSGRDSSGNEYNPEENERKLKEINKRLAFLGKFRGLFSKPDNNESEEGNAAVDSDESVASEIERSKEEERERERIRIEEENKRAEEQRIREEKERVQRLKEEEERKRAEQQRIKEGEEKLKEELARLYKKYLERERAELIKRAEELRIKKEKELEQKQKEEEERKRAEEQKIREEREREQRLKEEEEKQHCQISTTEDGIRIRKCFSWTEIGEKCAVKELDKSGFEKCWSRIPIPIQSFFNADKLQPSSYRGIFLLSESSSYSGTIFIDPEDYNAGRPKANISWSSELKPIINGESNENTKTYLVFIKTDAENKYRIDVANNLEDVIENVSKQSISRSSNELNKKNEDELAYEQKEEERSRAEELRIKEEKERKQKQRINEENMTQVEIDDITKCVLRLHNFFNDCKRFTEKEFNKISLKDGLFVVFEKGEKYYTYDRIVYVGVNRVDGALKDRIKQIFRGNSGGAVLRKYIGAAIIGKTNPEAIDTWLRINDTEFDAELSHNTEEEVSSYMNQNMSVACVYVPVQIRNKLQKQIVDILKIEYANTPDAISKNWLGRNFVNSDISKDGVWMKTKSDLLEQDEIDINEIISFLDSNKAVEIELEEEEEDGVDENQDGLSVIDTLIDSTPEYIPKAEDNSNESFVSYSWTVVPEICAIKEVDKSVKLYGETGVPTNVLPFFDAEDLIPGFSKNLTFKIGYREYVGSIHKTDRGNSNLSPITKIRWNEKVQKLIVDYCTYAKKPALLFKKTEDDEYYELVLIDDKEVYIKSLVPSKSALGITDHKQEESSVHEPDKNNYKTTSPKNTANEESHIKVTKFYNEFTKLKFPDEFATYFQSADLPVDMNQKITLNFRGKEFPAFIRKSISNKDNNVFEYSISWSKTFGQKIEEYLSNASYINPALVFTWKTFNKKFDIDIAQETKKWDVVFDESQNEDNTEIFVRKLPSRVPLNEIIKNPSLSNAKIRFTLINHYQNGFLTKSNIEIKRFRKSYEKDHGLSCELDNDHLLKEIRNSGFEFNEKIFILSEDTIIKLRTIIEESITSNLKIIYYINLYRLNQEWLNEGHIVSEEMMIMILKRLFPYYHFKENYVYLSSSRKVNELDAIENDFMSVWGEQTLRTFEELQTMLPYLPIEKIRFALSQPNNFVWTAPHTYTRKDLFRISPEEIKSIRNYALDKCNRNGSVTFDELPFENIIAENFELSEKAINDIVFSKICDNFDRNNNVITLKGGSQLTSDSIKEFCKKHESCTIEQLEEVMESVSGSTNMTTLLEAAHSVMVRINETHFVSDERINFSVTDIDAVLDQAITEDATSLKSISTFALFPSCGFSWNHYILESYCRRFSNKYRFVCNQANSNNIGAIVKVGSTDDYHIVMAKCVANSKIQLNETAVYDYLYNNGFIARRRYSRINDLIKLSYKFRLNE